jgi:hypothetical protein
MSGRKTPAFRVGAARRNWPPRSTGSREGCTTGTPIARCANRSCARFHRGHPALACSSPVNTDSILFVDVDLPEPAPKGILSGLFRRRQAREEARVEAESRKIRLLDDWQRSHSTHAFRVYRTAAGLRYVLVSTLAPARSPVVDEIFEKVEADPNYRRLCRVQQSFRARLTPKPWRCGLERPALCFPVSGVERASAGSWLARYEEATRRHAVCLYLLTLGSTPVAPEISRALEEHDRRTGADSGRPLA